MYKKYIYIISIYRSLVISMIFLCLLGCGNLGISNIETSSYYGKPKYSLRYYNALELTDFETFNPDVPNSFKTNLPLLIADKLINSNIGFQHIKYGPINNIASNKTLIMLAEITDIRSAKDIEYEKGSLTFGESALAIQLAFVQKDNGDEILTGEIVGFSSFGESLSEKFFEDIANEIIELIAANY